MDLLVGIAVTVIALTLVPASYRVLIGPTNADRAVAADLVFFVFVALVAMTSLVTSINGLDIVLVATVVGFLGTLSVARLVTRGER